MLNHFVFVGKVKTVNSFPLLVLLSLETSEGEVFNFNITALKDTLDISLLTEGTVVAVKGKLAGGLPVELVVERLSILSMNENLNEVNEDERKFI